MEHRHRKLSKICKFKLNEIYHSLYEFQHKLTISDEYLMSCSKNTPLDQEQRDALSNLLDASKSARDDLITWFLKETVHELNVTISLVTAKIKLIEYKLDLCDGLDLHQACSLSLVNFCNILSDMTVVNVDPSERKTMHKVSAEANIPVWLSHYRNQICHVPSESPCISILAPLVIKSLNYMQESFWSKMMETDTFDAERFKKFLLYISNLTHVTSINRQLHLKKSVVLSKKQKKIAEANIVKNSKACGALRRMLYSNPSRAVQVASKFVVALKYGDKSRNFPLLLEQIIYANCFESFVFQIVSLVEQNPNDAKCLAWLKLLISLISCTTKAEHKEFLRGMNLNASAKVRRYTDISSIKCCRISFRLAKLDNPNARKLIMRLRHKVMPVIGEQKTNLFMKLTRIAGFLSDQ